MKKQSNHFMQHPGVRPPCSVLLLLPVDCHLAATMSIHFISFHFVSSHTSLAAGVHIDSQRDPVSGRSLRSQADLVAGIMRCNCRF
jgi:hypothetical protein